MKTTQLDYEWFVEHMSPVLDNGVLMSQCEELQFRFRFWNIKRDLEQLLTTDECCWLYHIKKRNKKGKVKKAELVAFISNAAVHEDAYGEKVSAEEIMYVIESYEWHLKKHRNRPWKRRILVFDVRQPKEELE